VMMIQLLWGRSMLPERLRWRTLRYHMTANSTLVTHGSFRSLPLFLPLNLSMWAFRSDVPRVTTVMACERLSSDRKLGRRLRDDRNFPFHNSFSLIDSWGWRFGNNWLHENGLGGRRRNIPESGLVSWTLLNGEHVSELLV
jgi:hypothetical protein